MTQAKNLDSSVVLSELDESKDLLDSHREAFANEAIWVIPAEDFGERIRPELMPKVSRTAGICLNRKGGIPASAGMTWG